MTKDFNLNQTVSKCRVPRLGQCFTEIHRNSMQLSLHIRSSAIEGFITIVKIPFKNFGS